MATTRAPPWSAPRQLGRSMSVGRSPPSSLDGDTSSNSSNSSSSGRIRQHRSGSSGRSQLYRSGNNGMGKLYRSGSSQLHRSGSSTPTTLRKRELLGAYRYSSSETLAVCGSGGTSRSATPFRQSRSRSPARPPSESDALEAPGVQQEAVTRAFIYPSSFHYNLRLAGLVLVVAHVSCKTILPWLMAPLTLSWTPRSLLVTGPF